MSTSTDTELLTADTSTLIQSTSVSKSTGTTSKSTVISNSNESGNSNTYITNDDIASFDDNDNSILVDVVNSDIETTVAVDSEEETSYTATFTSTKPTSTSIFKLNNTTPSSPSEDNSTSSYDNLNDQHATSISNLLSPTLPSGQPLYNINTSPNTPPSTSVFTSLTTSGELSEACSGIKSVTLLAKSGYITSPGFENNQPYPPNISCNWEIVEQENEVTIFNIYACQINIVNMMPRELIAKLEMTQTIVSQN